jgi:hypothetical protein
MLAIAQRNNYNDNERTFIGRINKVEFSVQIF